MMNPQVTDHVLSADLRHVIYALSDALDLVGIDDIAHGKRVGIMAAECAQAQGLAHEETAFLFDLGLLHDIGVSSTVTHSHLVSEFDWESSQGHCEVGYALLSDFAPLAKMALPIKYHHTHWEHLLAQGIDAHYIVGGIEAWQAAGLPLEMRGGAA